LNIARNFAATVGGGQSNTASGSYATVGGGWNNTASNFAATVGGGYGNTASGDYSAIPGGYNLRVGARSFGFSGQTSVTQTDLSTNSNIAAFVDVDLWLYSRDFTNASQLRFYEAQAHGSGANYVALQAPNTLSANTTYTLPADLTTTNTVATGILQTDASGNLSWISPTGLAAATAWTLTGNSIASAWDGTSGNFLGTTNAQPLVIATTNTASPQPIQVWVGNQETFRFNPPGTSAPAWSIQRGGGDPRGLHAVDLQSARSAATQVASGNYSVIGGGLSNTASSSSATVGGGYGNTASGGAATIGGGVINTASGDAATVGGGFQNTASGYIATVGGGYQNTASGDWATVGGGIFNTASGDYSVVPGGYSNTANGVYNLVFGEDVDPSVTETHRVYFFSPTNSGFLVINRLNGDYPIHVGTNTGNGNGAYLTTGGAWTNGSSRSFKERFVQYRPAEVLEKIRQLPVEGYFYKGTEEYHITPMAEDFSRLFGTGVHEIIETDSTGQLVRRPNPEVDKYLAASDVAGVALLGVQALAERVDMLQPQSGALAQRLEALEQENKQIKEENRHLQQRVEVLLQQNGRLQQQLEQVMKRLALLEAQHSNLAESQK
jgi:FtsZ-binding cell division protein ZapB